MNEVQGQRTPVFMKAELNKRGEFNQKARKIIKKGKDLNQNPREITKKGAVT